MKKRYPHKQNVLLVNITRLGDMLQATPTIAGLKMENPNCKVTVLVEKQFEEVCHTLPNVDYVMSIDLGMTVRSLAREQEGIIEAYEYLSELVEQLKSKNFDYCLNMSSSAYTALLLKLIGIERNGGWTSDEEGYRVIESDWARLFASSVFHQNRQYNALNLVDVFRCSADVEAHPKHLLIEVKEEATQYSEQMIAEAGFSNTGPLIAVQAGASQDKRQWEPKKFIKLINILTKTEGARVVLTGTKKELPLVQEIAKGCDPKNVYIAAGKTTIPQLAALLKLSQVLITGDTGPMHMSVAVGTPVVAMFLASAFGFETGPYSSGNILLQPVIGCGPCNPNKPCAGLECHETLDPELIATLAIRRAKGDVLELEDNLADPDKVIVYRTYFDEYGFYNLKPLNSPRNDPLKLYRDAYRKLWLDDLGGYEIIPPKTTSTRNGNALKIIPDSLAGLSDLIKCAKEGQTLINELTTLIEDSKSSPQRLSQTNQDLSELDRRIEHLGFHYAFLGPVSRMFVFAKENLSGTDPKGLASQMERIYGDLGRRCMKLETAIETQ